MSRTAKSVLGRDITDADLVDQARHGDRKAMELLMRRHNQRLFRIAVSILRDRSEAEDALQEGYVRAFTRLEQFKGEGAVGAWLAMIIVNEARKIIRARRPTTSIDAGDASSHEKESMEAEMTRHHGAPPTPEQDLAATQARGFIERAVHSLPDGFREVFILRAVEGMSVQETADCLDLEPTTVRTRFFRARAQMRKRLDGEVLSLVGSLYPFAGQSCDRVVENVLRRLNEQHETVVLN